MKSFHRSSPNRSRRFGAVAPFLAIMLIPILAMVAFAVDYGYLTVVRTDLQRAADASVLAAVLDLVPRSDGSQDFATARARVREYANLNLATGNSFTVPDADIEFGRYDETTIYGGTLVLQNSGIFDTVRVTLRRDNTANSPVGLFFANVLGISSQSIVVSATAVLRRGVGIKPQGDVLPFALPEAFWDSLAPGEQLRIFNDNKLEDGFGNQVTVIDDDGNSVPGNWGTVDIGPENNSTSALAHQILYGLEQSDLNALYAAGRIGTTDYLGAPLNLQADPGLSAGMKDAVRAIHGQERIIPIYDSLNGEFASGKGGGGGNNAEFHVVKWGVVKVLNSNWGGNKNTWILSEKSFTYDGALVPREDLSDSSAPPIDGAFTSPVLVR